MKVVGKGTFGDVFQAYNEVTGEVVAIKKVFQDRRYKNRELQIIKELNHPNVVRLLEYYYTPCENKPDDVYLNLVMDFIPETLYRIKRKFEKINTAIPPPIVKLYAYQMFRALAYIHSVGICHRDIKPQNVLIDYKNHKLKICDFGSAKKLVKGEANIAYISTRFYRAPELIFGATDYTVAIDVWSTACVIAELVIFEPLFQGESSVDQLVEIIKVLGVPTKEQIRDMNPNQGPMKFPNIKPQPWTKVFGPNTDPLFIDLISKTLTYSPKERLNAVQALCHPYFDELRNLGFKIDGAPVAELHDFSRAELEYAGEYAAKLLPKGTKKRDD
jgi:glycogen synthase kinase 3 beta